MRQSCAAGARLLPALLGGIVLAGSGPAGAAPGRVALIDVEGPRAPAQAITLLLRSSLHDQTRALVPPAELGGVSHVEMGDAARALLKRLHADRLVLANLEVRGEGAVIAYHVLDADFFPLAAGTVAAALVDLDEIAAQVARRVAEATGLGFDASATATLDELEPFVEASAPDRSGAALDDALAAADPDVAARLRAADAIVRQRADDASLPAQTRLLAAMAAHDAKLAQSLAPSASGGLAVRAYLASGDKDRARREATRLTKSKEHALELARAELLADAGDLEGAGRAFAPLAADDPAAALSLARLPPQAARAAAAGLTLQGKTSPGLRARLVTKAIQAGADEALVDGLPLERVPSAHLQVLALAVPKESARKARLLALVKARARYHAWGSDPITATDAPKALSAPTVARAVAHHLSTTAEEKLADSLEPLLELFAALKPKIKLRLGQLAGPSTSLLREVDVPLVEAALREALARDPRFIHAKQASGQPEKPNGWTADVDVAMGFRARPRGASLELDLVVLESALERQQIETFVVRTDQVSVVRVRLPVLIAFGVFVLMLPAIGWLLYRRLVLVGGVRVDLSNKLGSTRETFALHLSRSPRAPAIKDAGRFEKAERDRGVVTAHGHASMAAGTTHFRRVTVGTWYVHLIGVYTVDGETMVLPSGLLRVVRVHKGKEATVRYELPFGGFALRVKVQDRRPVAGAQIRVDHAAESIETPKGGELTLLLGKGEHLLEIEARGSRIERPIAAGPTEPVELVIDLRAERKRAQAAPAG